MPDWEQAIASIASDVENQFDKFKFRLMRKLSGDPIVILPYIGHGTRRRLYLKGRVMEKGNVSSARDNDDVWDNLLNMYRRFETDEIPRAKIRARYGDHTVEVQANEEGFFEVQIEPDEDLPADKVWYSVELALIDFPGRQHELQTVENYGQVIVPPPDAQFGVISDMDDTVIQSDVLNLVKLARNTFLQNARTRLPFEGVAAFYRVLQAGTHGGYNPIFYLSSSPYNLYDLFIDFFEVREIPLGTFFLTNFGLTENHLLKPGHEEHKLGTIRRLLNTHPDLPFILIGDSGEHDPDIYTQAALEFPGRIAAIYIRDVSKNEEREREILRLADRLKAIGVDLLLVPDTVAAAEHAVLKGFIPEDALLDIRVARSEDQKPPEPVEKLIDPRTEPDDLATDNQAQEAEALQATLKDAE